MINLNGKSEPESMKLKKKPFEEQNYYKDSKSTKIIIILFCLIVCFCIFMILSFLIYKKVTNYQSIILEKNNELKEIQKKFDYLKNEQKNEQKKRLTESEVDKEYKYDINFYKANNMQNLKDLNRLGYFLIIHTHSLEKGLEHFELRPFAQKTVYKIMNLLKKELKYDNHTTDFSFINGINSLRKYKKTYEEHKWVNKSIYKDVSTFLKDYEKVPEQKTGAFILTKEELKKDYSIDYKKFIKSRHSTRNYKNLELKIEDIKEAIEIAKYSASACNRQYIKVHYYPKGKMRQNVIDYSIGKGGLYLEGVNTFIITFDVNGLIHAGERNQGYFNAGLFATNLVNGFHSLGIGTCFIQFANSVTQEETLKKANNIPHNERIAVILYAGYYDEKSIFVVSPRKNVENILTEHK